MIQLVKESSAGVLGKRQWWSVGDFTALVAYGSEGCGISVCDADNRDITDAVAHQMNAMGSNVATALSIDSVMITCPEAAVKTMLVDIGKVLSA